VDDQLEGAAVVVLARPDPAEHEPAAGREVVGDRTVLAGNRRPRAHDAGGVRVRVARGQRQRPVEVAGVVAQLDPVRRPQRARGGVPDRDERAEQHLAVPELPVMSRQAGDHLPVDRVRGIDGPAVHRLVLQAARPRER
jgi:hypothetical protein